MDQLKPIIAGIKKNAFWIVSGLTVLLSIVGYWMSRSAMDKVFTDQSGKIDAQYASLQTIKGEVPTHPNSKSHEKMQQLVDALTVDVEAAWKKQFERQAEILQWPTGPDGVPDKFIAKVKKLSPIELTLEYPIPPGADPLVKGDQNDYAKYLNKQFPRLAKIIGTEWVGTPPVAASAAGMNGMMGDSGMMSGAMDTAMATSDMSMTGMPGSGMPGMPGMGMPAKKVDLVTWPKAAQDKLIADVQMWKGAYPTTHEVLYTQENIWILEGLLNIIANVNKKANALANFQATVKEIEFLRIGRSAVGKVGTIDRPQSGAPVGADGMMMGEGMEGMLSDAVPSTEYATEGTTDPAAAEGGMVIATPDPANGRYVDAAFAPLTGDDLRSKMKSASPEDAYFAVAKRVPVRMRLKVDQRKVQTLIAECGNASLLFEIRQIRLGDTAAAPDSNAGGAFGTDVYASGASDMAPTSDMGYSGDMSGSGMPMNMLANQTQKVWDIPVEIYGIVYLFNPVDTSKLGLTKVTAETVVSDKVEVSADEQQAASPEAAQAAQAGAQPAAGAPAQPAAQHTRSSTTRSSTTKSTRAARRCTTGSTSPGQSASTTQWSSAAQCGPRSTCGSSASSSGTSPCCTIDVIELDVIEFNDWFCSSTLQTNAPEFMLYSTERQR